ncbi:hypothetical protein Goshw_023246, partial [Gossypium schwendimanii]|nr:hypothetical protein [Gossypium schwendimanii]
AGQVSGGSVDGTCNGGAKVKRQVGIGLVLVLVVWVLSPGSKLDLYRNKNRVGLSPHCFFWKTIWKLKTLPKIRVFALRLGHEIFPTNAKIASIRQNVNKECPRCEVGTETLVHALKDCPTPVPFSHVVAWMNSWNNRNNFIFHGKEEDARIIWERAITLSKDFRIHNMVNKPMLPLSPYPKKREKPLKGTMKISFDIAVSNTKTSFGVISHNSEGFFIGRGFSLKNEEMAGHWNTNMDRFNKVAVNWANSNCIKVADFLSNYAISNEDHLVFGMDYPIVIHNLVIDDVILLKVVFGELFENCTVAFYMEGEAMPTLRLGCFGKWWSSCFRKLPIKAGFFQNLSKWADFLIIYRNGPFFGKSRPCQRDLLTWKEITPSRTRFPFTSAGCTDMDAMSSAREQYPN